MLKLNGPGPVTALDEKLITEICNAMPRVMILKHVANLTLIPYQTLFHWMKRGKREIDEGVTDSIYVRLVLEYNRRRSEVLEEKLAELGNCPKNYGAITWMLEKCYKEDFEVKSEYVKQLEDYIFNQIKPMLAKGGMDNGGEEIREMDTEGDQASWSTP